MSWAMAIPSTNPHLRSKQLQIRTFVALAAKRYDSKFQLELIYLNQIYLKLVYWEVRVKEAAIGRTRFSFRYHFQFSVDKVE